MVFLLQARCLAQIGRPSLQSVAVHLAMDTIQLDMEACPAYNLDYRLLGD